MICTKISCVHLQAKCRNRVGIGYDHSGKIVHGESGTTTCVQDMRNIFLVVTAFQERVTRILCTLVGQYMLLEVLTMQLLSQTCFH